MVASYCCVRCVDCMKLYLLCNVCSYNNSRGGSRGRELTLLLSMNMIILYNVVSDCSIRKCYYQRIILLESFYLFCLLSRAAEGH